MQKHRRLFLVPRVAELDLALGADLFELFLKLFGLARGRPAFHEESGFGLRETQRGGLPVAFLRGQFVEDAQPGQIRRQRAQFVFRGFFLIRDLFQFVFQRFALLSGRALGAGELRGREIRRGKGFLRRLRVVAMGDRPDARLVPVRADNLQPCGQRRESALERLHPRRADGTGKLHGIARRRQLFGGDIKRKPGAQLRDLHAGARFAGAHFAFAALARLARFHRAHDRRRVGRNGLRLFFRRLGDAREHVQQALFLHLVAGKQRNGPFDAGKLFIDVFRLAAAGIQIRLQRFVLNFGNFHAAHALHRPKQPVPVGAQRKER